LWSLVFQKQSGISPWVRESEESEEAHVAKPALRFEDSVVHLRQMDITRETTPKLSDGYLVSEGPIDQRLRVNAKCVFRFVQEDCCRVRTRRDDVVMLVTILCLDTSLSRKEK
jgi:hypothetical protein